VKDLKAKLAKIKRQAITFKSKFTDAAATRDAALAELEALKQVRYELFWCIQHNSFFVYNITSPERCSVPMCAVAAMYVSKRSRQNFELFLFGTGPGRCTARNRCE
jgi:hypothetical protein